MKSKIEIQKLAFIILTIFVAGSLFGGIATKTSDPFTLDTRDLNPIPENGWQVVSNLGNTYNEELLIDDHGKVWIFYYESPGANQPIYLKIFKSDAHLYLYKTIVGYGSSDTEPRLNTIRAELNPITGDIWAAFQGNDGGYFVVFDSSGNVRIDSTLLATDAYLPKLAIDKDGTAWFSWHTANRNREQSKAHITAYNYQGDHIIQPMVVSQQNYVFNTDIAVDDSNRIWIVYETNNSGQFTTTISIYETNGDPYKLDQQISTSPLILNPKRAFYADNLNQRMWFLEKNGDFDAHNLRLFTFDLTQIAIAEGIGSCDFVRNELNRIEIVRFNTADTSNKIYEHAQFDPFVGDQLTDWQALYDSTYQFTNRSIAYNRSAKNLKVFLVNQAERLTRVKFLTVETGFPQISVTPTTLNFDTTKIKAGYAKTKEITVKNLGNEILNVQRIVSPLPVFSITDTSFSLLPQQAKVVEIRFSPTDTNVVSTEIEIISDDPNNGTVTVAVSGRGYLPSNPQIIVSPPTLIFDEVVIGSEQSLFIYVQNNDKYEPLVISSIAHRDTQFIVDKTEFIVPPRQGKYVNVVFRPVVASELITDSLIIENNDPDTSRFIVPMFASSRAPLKPQIVVTPDSLYFGEVAVGEKKTLSIAITNKGEAQLEVSNIISDKAQFVVDSTEFVITAQNTKYVNVTFSPQTEGKIEGQLSIISNDDQNPEYTVPVVGVGRVLSDPYLVYDKTELNFGKIQQGDTLQKFILLQNFGDRVLKVYDFKNDDSSFRPLVSDTIQIEKGDSYYLWVEFAPQDTMQHNDVMVFRSNDPNNEFVEINLVGKGEPNEQQLIVSFDEINFGNVLIHSQAKDSLLISNIGSRTLNISNILSTNSHFRPGVTFFNLGPEETQKVYITFRPDSIKLFTGRLIIVSNDPVADSIFIQLSGTGRDSTDQHLYVSSDTLDFGIVAKNNSKIMSLVLHNTGEKNLKISNMFNTSDAFSLTSTQLTILGKSFRTVYLTFEPTESINYLDTLRIISNDPEEDTSRVILTGQGREPLAQKISVPDTILDFGSVAFGRSMTKYVTVYNVGEKNLSVFNIAIADTQFQIAENWFILEPGENKTFAVTFTPTSEIQANSLMQIESNDPENKIVNVHLYGKGTVYEGPDVEISPDYLDFGRTLLGATKQMAFYIYNNSSVSTLNITDVTISNSMFEIAKMPNSVAPSGMDFILVKYHPVQEGAHFGTLTIFTNDVFNEQVSLELIGSGVIDVPTQNTLSQLGWIQDASAPFGDAFSGFGISYTGDILSDRNEKALFIKDIYLDEPVNDVDTYMNLCFKNGITVIVNNTMIFDSTDTNLKYWNKENLNVAPYLTLGRNRIAVVVRTNNNSSGNDGGFDCEMFVNGQPKIRRGDQNWNQPDALWWYFYPVTTIPTDNINDRLWFSSDYALNFADSIKAMWSFEPTGSDTIFDSSVYGKRVILHNIQWVDGIVGKAMEFSGEEKSYAEIEANLNEMPLDIEMWLNCYDARGYRQLIFSNRTQDDQYGNGLFIEPDLRLGVYFYNGEYVFPDFTLPTNDWQLISVQYGYSKETSLSYVTVFVDGDTVGTYEYQTNYPTGPASRFYLGGVPQIDSDAFYGAVDEIVIKNTVSGKAPLPEVANIDLAEPLEYLSKTDSTLTFRITPLPFRILSGELVVYRGGDPPTSTPAWADTLFWERDSVYSSNLTIQIPVRQLDIRGIYFALTLTTNFGSVRYPAEGYKFLRYQTEKELANVALLARRYRMVSVPYELENPNVQNVLRNFEPYDPYQWRLFDWSQSDSIYIEYSDTTSDTRWKFQRGKAFWLVTNGIGDFIGPEGATPKNEEYRIVLEPGWNMFANPFPYPIPFSMMRSTDDTQLQGPFYYQTEDSIGWLPPQQLTFCQPWQGYFIWNSDSVEQTLIVPPVGVDEVNLPKPLAPDERVAFEYSDASFIINVDAYSGKYFDVGNLFGAAQKAKTEFDRYDSPEVPEISNYVSLWSDNFDWKYQKGAYQNDFQKSGENGYVWNLVLDCQVPGAKSAGIQFRQIKEIPTNWEIYLFDTDEDIAYNLKERASISFVIPTQNGMKKHFKLVVGDNKFIQQNSDEIPLVPVQFALKQNYPNPFNSVTAIEFSLPKRMNVEVDIYNILGQRVRTLVNGEMRGGIHKLIWNGANQHGQIVPSGMYFVKLKGENGSVAVKKLLLLK